MRKQIILTTSLLTLASLLPLSYASDAQAFELYGGKYTQDPLNKKYYNFATTYSATSLMNHSLPFDDAVNSWNNTENTRIWWIKTSVRSESILDMTTKSDPDIELYGKTEHYSGNDLITDTNNYWWYWALVWTNEKARWTAPSTAPYQMKGRLLQSVSAHEIGHALGLAHNGTSIMDYNCCSGYLMYYGPDAYWKKGIYKPTSDEVLGIQKLYGRLY